MVHADEKADARLSLPLKKLKRAKMLIEKGLTVREAAARIKISKTALYDAIKSETSQGSPK